MISIEVDAALENRLRERAAEAGISFDQLAAEALSYALSEWDADALDAQEARRRLAEEREPRQTFAQFEDELDAERKAAA